VLPKSLCQLILPTNHEVTLSHANRAECLDDTLGEGPAEALPTLRLRHSKVL
jgi:hypothetical protein